MADIFNGVKNHDIEEVKQALSEDPSCINAKDKLGRVPAMYSAMRGDSTMLDFLAEQEGFDALLEDRQGKGLLEFTFWTANFDFARHVFHIMYPLDKDKTSTAGPRPSIRH